MQLLQGNINNASNMQLSEEKKTIYGIFLKLVVPGKNLVIN